jgi:hypothetical protein
VITLTRKPFVVPLLPESMAWRRLLRLGAVFHVHKGLGRALCGQTLGRHESTHARTPADLRHYGLCVQCQREVRKVKRTLDGTVNRL